MLYVFSTCVHFIRTVPQLVYDAANVEDIDTEGEDHIYDECRYVLMERPISPPERRARDVRRVTGPLDEYAGPCGRAPPEAAHYLSTVKE